MYEWKTHQTRESNGEFTMTTICKSNLPPFKHIYYTEHNTRTNSIIETH